MVTTEKALDGKVAVITGAGRGLGRAIALAYAQQGAKVVVNDPGVNLDGSGTSRAVADAVAGEIQQASGDAIPSYDSVTTMQGGENIVKAALEQFGKLDIVVTSAGILRDRMVFNMTEEEWDLVIATHLKGTFTVVKPACVLFRQQRSGRIITMSSEIGLMGNSGQSNYGSAKSGIVGFTKVVARDMGRYGVTANAIIPRANTRLTQVVVERAEELAARGRTVANMEPEEIERFRTWSPEDVAPFAVFLGSDLASHVNGQTFLVYGNVISLLSQPRLVKTIFKPEGFWSVEELRQLMPQNVCKGLVNPAPPLRSR